MNKYCLKGHLILKKNTVILSVNNDEGNLCVDIFFRENKTFGFEEYRKDPENIDGWYKIGNYSDKICLLYTSPSPRDISGSRMPSSA